MNDLPSIGDLEAQIQPQEGDIYVIEVRGDRYNIYRHDGEQWRYQINWGEEDTQALVSPMQFLGETKGHRRYYRPTGTTSLSEARKEKEEEDAAKIQRLEVLANDSEHLRISALEVAGSILHASEEEVVAQLINELDEDVVEEGGALYEAYERLFQAIAKEVVKIGRELQEQAKEEQQS